MTRSDVWYHLYPLGFLGAEERNLSPGAPDGEVSHRLPGLVDWLDELVELGVTGLLLGPVFESETHGYDLVDPYRIDRRLGHELDLVGLIDQCHRRNLRVGLDMVFHHVGRHHAHFLDVREHGRASVWRDWFLIDFDRPGRDGFSYADFEGHAQLVKLNHFNGQVLDWAADVARYWIDRGVDAFRLDAAYAIPARFLATFADRVRDMRSDLLLVGEVIHGDYVKYAAAAHLSTVTQYELWKATWSALNDRNFYELSHSLERHAEFCRHFLPWNFVGNHDTTRIRTRLHDPRHVHHALAILFTVPGIPAIYAGDEQGAEGTKYEREGGDAEIRRPLPYQPKDLPRDDLPIWQVHRELIAIRRARPWLADGRLRVTQLSNRSIVLEVQSQHKKLVTALSTDDQAVDVDIPAGAVGIGGQGIDEPHETRLGPHQWGIWSVE